MVLIVCIPCFKDCPLAKGDPDWCLHCDLNLPVSSSKLD